MAEACRTRPTKASLRGMVDYLAYRLNLTNVKRDLADSEIRVDSVSSDRRGGVVIVLSLLHYARTEEVRVDRDGRIRLARFDCRKLHVCGLE